MGKPHLSVGEAMLSISRYTRVNFDRPGVNPTAQIRDLAGLPLAEPFRDRQRTNAVMTVYDKRAASKRLVNLTEAGGNLTHGDDQQSGGHGDVNLTIGRLVRFTNIEQCEGFTGGQALFEPCGGQFQNL
jgi:hypothetical protein